VMYLVLASQSARFLIEARRSSLMELLLATPMTVHQIVQGQWHALRRQFGPPLALCLAAQLLGSFLVHQRTWNRMAAVSVPPPASRTALVNSNGTANVTIVTSVTVNGRVTVITNRMAAATNRTVVKGPVSARFALVGGNSGPNLFAALVAAVMGTGTMLANLIAVGWFGMWQGLTSRSTNLATLKTLVFVQIIPWFVISFAAGLIIPLILLPALIGGASGASMRTMIVWYPLLTVILTSLLGLGKDLGFFLWSRRNLHEHFRQRAVNLGERRKAGG
jgi:hypothetical protein